MTHIYLAFQKGQRRRIEWLTRFVTRSIYCHVEVFETPGAPSTGDVVTMWSSDSWTGCVRKKVEIFDPDFWDIVRVPWAPRDGIRRVEALEGCPYDKKALFFTQFINLRLSNAGEYICTAVAGEAIGLTNPERYSPQELKDAVEDINRVYLAARAQPDDRRKRPAKKPQRRANRPMRPAHVINILPVVAGTRARHAAPKDRQARPMPAGIPAPPPP